jgi:hypothetical protein
MEVRVPAAAFRALRFGAPFAKEGAMFVRRIIGITGPASA